MSHDPASPHALQALQHRYARFQSTVGLNAQPTVWADTNFMATTDLDNFRGGSNNHYVFQDVRPAVLRQLHSKLLASSNVSRSLLARTHEDGSFNVTTVRAETFLWPSSWMRQADGHHTAATGTSTELLSRDLLDSVSELTFLSRVFGDALSRLSILDVGAGYGRLCKRFRDCFPQATYACVDGLAFGTYLSRRYLRHYGFESSVVALPSVAHYLASHRVDLVINIHSFPEMPLRDVTFWISLVANASVPHLFLVPNDVFARPGRLLTNDGTPIEPLLTRHGYRLARYSRFMQDELGMSSIAHGLAEDHRSSACRTARTRARAATLPSTCYTHAAPYFLFSLARGTRS